MGAATTARLVQGAADARVLARDLAPRTEAERRLPDELVDLLRGSGLLRAGAPTGLGAAQAPPAVTLAAAEDVARGDASAGWCTSIAATSSLLAAYLPADGAEEVLGDAGSVAVGVWAPRGRGVPVPGGLRVTGRWAFCSGIGVADWFFAGCLVDGAEAGAPPLMRVVAMHVDELQVLDTWHTGGLRGTGSHDCVADDVLVPDTRVLDIEQGPRLDEALYRFPLFGFFALSIGAAALGNARGALDDLAELAGVKSPQGSSKVLAEKATTQAAVAQAEAALRAARSFYYDAVEQAWSAAQAGGPVGVEERTGLRLAATHAVRTAAEVTRAMYDLGGGSAVYETSPLQRRFRDAHTATAHIQVSPSTWELTGRLLLDLPTRTAQL